MQITRNFGMLLSTEFDTVSSTMELVVLVDEQNNVLGTASKDEVHSNHTPLHRGFSLFLFNSKGELLVTRRSLKKKTFPGVWTNTLCGHPGPDEAVIDAAKRRLKEELGIESTDIKEVAPYRYRFTDSNGIVENEICPVLVGTSDDVPQVNSLEVAEWKWMDWKQFLNEINVNPSMYSPWSREEAVILQRRDREQLLPCASQPACRGSKHKRQYTRHCQYKGRRGE